MIAHTSGIPLDRLFVVALLATLCSLPLVAQEPEPFELRMVIHDRDAIRPPPGAPRPLEGRTYLANGGGIPWSLPPGTEVAWLSEFSVYGIVFEYVQLKSDRIRWHTETQVKIRVVFVRRRDLGLVHERADRVHGRGDFEREHISDGNVDRIHM